MGGGERRADLLVTKHHEVHVRAVLHGSERALDHRVRPMLRKHVGRAAAHRLPGPVPSIRRARLRHLLDQVLLGAVLHPSAVHLRTRGWLAIEPCAVLVRGMGSAAEDVRHLDESPTTRLRAPPNSKTEGLGCSAKGRKRRNVQVDQKKR